MRPGLIITVAEKRRVITHRRNLQAGRAECGDTRFSAIALAGMRKSRESARAPENERQLPLKARNFLSTRARLCRGVILHPNKSPLSNNVSNNLAIHIYIYIYILISLYSIVHRSVDVPRNPPSAFIIPPPRTLSMSTTETFVRARKTRIRTI